MELIQENVIETQDDLLKCLRKEGFDVTQATVSRDIKDLRLVKTLGADGRYKYCVAGSSSSELPGKFFSLFSDAVVHLDQGQNIVCVHCHNGMAQAVCAAMDSLKWDGVVGTIAGDDTIFVLCRTNEAASALINELSRTFGR